MRETGSLLPFSHPWGRKGPEPTAPTIPVPVEGTEGFFHLLVHGVPGPSVRGSSHSALLGRTCPIPTLLPFPLRGVTWAWCPLLFPFLCLCRDGNLVPASPSIPAPVERTGAWCPLLFPFPRLWKDGGGSPLLLPFVCPWSYSPGARCCFLSCACGETQCRSLYPWLLQVQCLEVTCGSLSVEASPDCRALCVHTF